MTRITRSDQMPCGRAGGDTPPARHALHELGIEIRMRIEVGGAGRILIHPPGADSTISIRSPFLIEKLVILWQNRNAITRSWGFRGL